MKDDKSLDGFMKGFNLGTNDPANLLAEIKQLMDAKPGADVVFSILRPDDGEQHAILSHSSIQGLLMTAGVLCQTSGDQLMKHVMPKYAAKGGEEYMMALAMMAKIQAVVVQLEQITGSRSKKEVLLERDVSSTTPPSGKYDA